MVLLKNTVYPLGYWQKITLSIWFIALVIIPFADIEIITSDPLLELSLMAQGFIHADFFATEYLFQAIIQTLNFAIIGVSLGLLLGAPLALIYQHPLVSGCCAFLRAIHEIFWALLFLQVFGLSPVTGILAITIPFAATFARVFHDIINQSSDNPLESIDSRADIISRYTYGKIAQVLPQLITYTRYRFECALRSSAVLGFIGMPTLGYYLETAFKQGNYSEGAALMMIFVALIGTIRYWCPPKLLGVYLIIACITLVEIPTLDSSLLIRFISQDIIPPVLVNTLSFADVQWSLLYNWFSDIITQQAFPGAISTLTLALLALAASHFVTLNAHAIASKHLWPIPLAHLGQFILLIGRSVPEYILAFVFLILLGPSMLPAILALAIHNGSVIAYLTVQQSNAIAPPLMQISTINKFNYHIMPSIYPNMMALLFYRFEIIVRETAVFGILGIMTLGFYIDSNFSEIRYSNALILIICTALLNVAIDHISRRLLNSHKKLLTT
ncbi:MULTISPECIES: ABC transporter permease [unclassified Colwellia]|uniref:PhnE/PtxC family ABC transporter permease n=1 Tax=unclassified Colwellia TaxID=196834 RepID=UPI0015F3AC20|nr:MULTISPECIES: ABC transporter permease subunit [unclassified Colwellia]MBA6251042.1 ABC transporter permease subunit [Colwellia sp. MB3u-55]MBA6398220.1 ABC transporter permease subunit [Colwellia sp. BRX10-4]